MLLLLLRLLFAAVSAVSAVIEAFFFAFVPLNEHLRQTADEVIDRRFGALQRTVSFSHNRTRTKDATNTAIKGIAAKPACFM